MSATEWAEAINLAASEMTRANRAEARIEALERVLRDAEQALETMAATQILPFELVRIARGIRTALYVLL